MENDFLMLSNYNKWQNQKFYALCDELDDATRKKNMGAFFGSIHRTLDHILYGDIAWLERLRDHSFTPRDINQMMFESWEELKSNRFRVDQEIEDWVLSLNDEQLKQFHTYTSNVDNKERSVPYWALVHHIFHHQTHHRGQMTTLLSQLGIDFGSTDIPFMPMFSE